MLKRNRLMCVVLPLFFVSPSTLTPFHNQAWQLIENKVDNKEMVLKTDKYELIVNPIFEKLEKDKIEFEKKKAEEKRQKELEIQKKNEPQWQEFILTYYSSMNEENGGYENTTSQGKKLSRGGVANNVIPQNTKIYLEGYGTVTVNDKGSNKHFSIDTRLDVFVERKLGESDREYARRIEKMGVKKVKGYIIK